MDMSQDPWTCVYCFPIVKGKGTKAKAQHNREFHAELFKYGSWSKDKPHKVYDKDGNPHWMKKQSINTWKNRPKGERHE
jgi:hypothetical protein